MSDRFKFKAVSATQSSLVSFVVDRLWCDVERFFFLDKLVFWAFEWRVPTLLGQMRDIRDSVHFSPSEGDWRRLLISSWLAGFKSLVQWEWCQTCHPGSVFALRPSQGAMEDEPRCFSTPGQGADGIDFSSCN